MAATVRVDKRALAGLVRQVGVEAALQHVGDQVAETARARAPRRTGGGAESIHAEVVTDERGPAVRVSWDREHFYMFFHEVGTSRLSAHPFLRPALDAHYTL